MHYYIIYQTAFPGDIILSTSMARTISEEDPHGKIVFITTPAGNSILQNNKLIDSIIVYDKRSADRGPAGILRIARAIKFVTAGEESIYISPHRFARASIIGLISGSRIRAGFWNSALAFLYNRRIAYGRGIHEIERNFALLKSVFPGMSADRTPGRPELYPSAENYSRVKKIIYDKFKPGDTIVSISPGSVWRTKMWPEAFFKRLIEMLGERNVKSVLIGGPDDAGLCGRLLTENAINLAGKLTLLESAAAIGLTRTLVTNDSAPLHMASAMNVPSVAIFGPTTPALGFGPLADKSIVLERSEVGCRPCGAHGSNKCRDGHFKCMNNITPEAVCEEVIKIIKTN